MWQFLSNLRLPSLRTLLIFLLIISVFTRFWRLGDIREYIFDEVYHAFTAKMYALDSYHAWVWWESPPEGVAYEWTHPPLAKVIMSWGIMLFGGPGELPSVVSQPTVVQTQEEKEAERYTHKILTPNSFGWRFFSALFGVLATIALFLFTRSIFASSAVGFFSIFLFTFDLLPLVQSRIAMNDIFAVTFILFAFYFFTKRAHLLDAHLSLHNWFFASLFLGAAIASKWTSLFTIGIFGLYHSLTLLQLLHVHIVHEHKAFLSFLLLSLLHWIRMLVFFLLIPFAVYLLSYWQLFTTRIDDYKGNSLAEVVETKRWESELEFLRSNSTPDVKISEQERKIAFWYWLYSIHPYFADRFYIWWGLQKQMWWYHTNLEASHGYQSLWWTWPLNLRPVWFYVKYCTNPTEPVDEDCRKAHAFWGTIPLIADIYTMGNPLIFVLIIPTLVALSYLLTEKYRVWFYTLIPAGLVFAGSNALRAPLPTNEQTIGSLFQQSFSAFIPSLMLYWMLLFLFLVFVRAIEQVFSPTPQQRDHSFLPGFIKSSDFYALVLCLFAFGGYWLPWARSPRIMFFYHFFPPVIFFYPLLGYVLYRLFSYNLFGRRVVMVYCLLVVVSFVYFYPHVTGWLVPEQIRNQYFWLPSWK